MGKFIGGDPCFSAVVGCPTNNQLRLMQGNKKGKTFIFPFVDLTGFFSNRFVDDLKLLTNFTELE